MFSNRYVKDFSGEGSPTTSLLAGIPYPLEGVRLQIPAGGAQKTVTPLPEQLRFPMEIQ